MLSTTLIKTAIYSLGLSMIVVTTNVNAANGNEDNGQTPRGLLDQPISLPSQAAPAAQQAAALRNLQAQARAERLELKRMNESQLRRQAENEADRLAQLVLAEKLADEAQRFAAQPQLRNDALSEALEWYAIAAKRGYPGTAAIDRLIQVFPVKTLRN